MSEWVFLGRRLGPFMPRLSADVHALAQKMRQSLLTREDMPKLRSIRWRTQPMFDGREDTRSVFDVLDAILTELPDEGYKLFPWVVREVKKGNATRPSGEREWGDDAPGISQLNHRHAMDILNQTIHWMVWSYEHNKPMPDYMNKEFGFSQLEAWVYEMNARDVDTSDGINWPNSNTVYRFDDGWRIDDVGSADLPQEGELMGHCVGGYGYQSEVDSGQSSIYSLRDPQGAPHVTVQIGGQYDDGNNDMPIMQEYGKSDSVPIPEYKQRMDEWYQSLRDEGKDVEYSGDMDPEMEETMANTTVYPPTHEGIEEFYRTIQTDPWQFQYDQDPEYTYDRGRATQIERVPDYIGHPTETYTHNDDGGEYAIRAAIQHLYPAMDQTLAGLWDGTISADEAQWYAQAYIVAAHHTEGYSANTDNLDALVSRASQWVAVKKATPSPRRQQPSLFEPNDYFTERPVPQGVQAFLHYLMAYHWAGLQGARTHQYGTEHPNWPHVSPDEISNFGEAVGGYHYRRPNYFDQLEASAPGYFHKSWLNQLSGTVAHTEKQLIARLIKMTEVAPNPATAYPLATQMFIDVIEQSEASNTRAVDSASFNAEQVLLETYGLNQQWAYAHARSITRMYEHEGLEALQRIVSTPPTPSEEFANEMWPDTLPWGEAEQDYYRNAHLNSWGSTE